MPLFLSFLPEFPVLSGIFWKKGALREPPSSMHCCGQRLATRTATNTDLRDEKVFFRNRSFFKRKTLAADGTLPKIKELNAPLRNNKGLEDIMRIPRIDLIHRRILFKNTVNHRVLFRICKPLSTPHKVYRLPLVIQSCYSNGRIRQKLLTEILPHAVQKKRRPSSFNITSMIRTAGKPFLSSVAKAQARMPRNSFRHS